MSLPALGDKQLLIEKSRYDLEQLKQRYPRLFALHPVDADEPDESHWIMPHGAHHLMKISSRRYWQWLIEENWMEEIAHLYKRSMSLFIRSNNIGQRWLGKSPIYVFFLEQLQKVFPDALFIVIQRDLSTVQKSFSLLLAETRNMTLRHDVDDDRNDLVHAWLNYSVSKLDAFVKATPPERCLVVKFQDLISETELCTQKIYEHLGMDHSDAMQKTAPFT